MFEIGSIVAVVALPSESDDWFVVPASIVGKAEQNTMFGEYQLQGYGKITSLDGQRAELPNDKEWVNDNGGKVIVNEYIQCIYDKEVERKISESLAS